MIDLNNKHGNLQSIADDWAEDVWIYLIEKRKGQRMLLYNGVRYNKVYKKYYKVFVDSCNAHRLDSRSAFIAKGTLIKFIKNFKQNIAERSQIDYWKRLQDSIRLLNPSIIEVWKEVLVPIYESFTSAFAYKYLQRLNIRTCPYCNRNYTFTLARVNENDFITRPEYDHFYDKKDYPLLALSFYNLVPSCKVCNHGKSTKPAAINPFFEGFRSKLAIVHSEPVGGVLNKSEIKTLRDSNDFKLRFIGCNANEQKNIETFGLEKLYNEHRDYVLDLIEKSEAYNDLMCECIADGFQGVLKTPQEISNLVWGKYIGITDHEERPLSKLTHDVLEQIGIL